MPLLPKYWWPTDSDTVITQEGSQLLRRYGTYSARVQAPTAAFAGDPDAVDSSGNPLPLPPVIGSGIVSSPTVINPTEEKPWFTEQIAAWIVSGAIRLEMWDVTDCQNVIIWPPRESDLRAVSTEIGVWVDVLAVSPGEDFFNGTVTGRTTTLVQLALVADVLNTEFYVDGAMLLNSADYSETYFEGRASNLLVLAGNEELGIYKNPIAGYDLTTLDLTRRDAVTWPSEKIEIGANPRLKVDEFTLDTSTTRIFSVTRDLTTEAETAVQIVNTPRPMTMTRMLNMTKRKRRRLLAPDPEQTNRPANVTNVQAIVLNTQLEVTFAPAVGAARYEVREQGTGDTPKERYNTGRSLGPRFDSTRYIFSDLSGDANKTWNLSIRAYNRSGVASPDPVEITAEPGLFAEGARIPTDIDCLMYISMDEKYDQNKDLMEPTRWNGTGPSVVQIAAPGTAEHRRRIRWDQGTEENHMFIDFDPDWPFTNLGSTTVLPTSEKSGPSNHHIKLGDSDLGTAQGREDLFAGACNMIVDRRIATGGATGLDLVGNFSLVAWINPCLYWPIGKLWGTLNGESYPIWSRLGIVDRSAGGDVYRGWAFTMGGPPYIGNVQMVNPVANGLTFYYHSAQDLGVQQEDAADNGNAIFWAHDWHLPLDATDDGGGLAVDAGQYVGWLFTCLTVSAPYTSDDPSISYNVSDYTCWFGNADQDNLKNLGTFTAPAIFSTTFSAPPNETTPRRAQDIMLAINSLLDNNVFNDDSAYEDRASAALFANFDEMRVYKRALSAAEVLGLYNHPGGQKRTENPLEPDRQVLQP